VAHIEIPRDVPGIRALLAFRPEVATPITALANALMHAPNSLTRGEREIIAAYVSSLNECEYCRDSHAAIATCHLDDDDALVRSVIENPEASPISQKVKALLAIAARVQQGGRSVRATDIARARQEGATDIEIHDTVLIAAVFCMFNRYVDGLAAGTPVAPPIAGARARLVAEHGYSVALPQPATPTTQAMCATNHQPPTPSQLSAVGTRTGLGVGR
jgi:uncharacterized peroxidase-related enzyme